MSQSNQTKVDDQGRSPAYLRESVSHPGIISAIANAACPPGQWEGPSYSKQLDKQLDEEADLIAKKEAANYALGQCFGVPPAPVVVRDAAMKAYTDAAIKAGYDYITEPATPEQIASIQYGSTNPAAPRVTIQGEMEELLNRMAVARDIVAGLRQRIVGWDGGAPVDNPQQERGSLLNRVLAANQIIGEIECNLAKIQESL